MNKTLLALFVCSILILSALPSKADWNQANSVNLLRYNYALSHDKRYVAIPGINSEISVVNTETGEVEYFLQENHTTDYWFTSNAFVAFSPDDKYLYTHNFFRWDLEKKQLDNKILKTNTLYVEASPDGRYIAGKTSDKTNSNYIFLINPADTSDSIRIKSPQWFNNFHFTSDSKALVCINWNSSIYIFDINSREVVNEIKFDTIQTSCNFSLSHNNRYILISDYHDNDHLVAQDSAKYLNYLYDLKDNKMIKTWRAPLTTRTDFSSDDKMFVCPGDSSIEFRNTSDGSLVKEVRLRNYKVMGVMFLSNEKILLVNEKEKTMNMYDLQSNKLLPLQTHGGNIKVKFLDENRLLTVENNWDFMATRTSFVHLFDCNTKKLIWRDVLRGFEPFDLIVSPDKKITAVSFGKGFYIINNENGNYVVDSIPVMSLRPPFTFSPDSKNIVVMDTGKRVVIWDVFNNVKKTEYILDSPAKLLYYNKIGDTIFIIDGNQKVKLRSLDLKTGKINDINLDKDLSYGDWYQTVSLSDDNALLAFIMNNRVTILDIRKKDTVFSKPWIEKWPGNSRNISKDSKSLAVSYSDTVKIWNIETGELKKVVDLSFCPWVMDVGSYTWFKSGVKSIDFSDDNRKVAISNDDGVFIRDIDLLGVEDNAADTEPFSFSISPNPASGISHVDFNMNEAGYVKARLYSYSGILVKDYGEIYFEPGSNSFRIDNNGFESGMYFVELTIDGRKSIKPLVVAK